MFHAFLSTRRLDNERKILSNDSGSIEICPPRSIAGVTLSHLEESLTRLLRNITND
jgi:hypothetical protein